jgi:hypothetical protein
VSRVASAVVGDDALPAVESFFGHANVLRVGGGCEQEKEQQRKGGCAGDLHGSSPFESGSHCDYATSGRNIVKYAPMASTCKPPVELVLTGPIT